ncbi:MgtC/SapB family protein [Intestinirhabdus alba]|jgi:putative Mg2+ transporter-C (MgtC) family protein|uniref:Protein MgtC n=1 Tax=Intestinirhabdus alba TaxID=2899544 RepID=A0A6L6ISL5_9ENTR|nr:MgtC/SapB family protein [Intestinirhabdus alba]MTH48020.1 MgtC/SapB family protein [Intestinirhabdus alba]
MESLMQALPGEAVGHLSVILRMAMALLLGGAMGLERESRGKPVGFKTCVTLAVASCMLTIVSIESAEYFAGISPNIRSDPMRLAAQIISGVGFLGAGVILHRHDDAISGLTTAAIVWASAGLGIACGAGFWFHSLLTTALLMLAIKVSPGLFRSRPRRQPGKVTVSLVLEEGGDLADVLDQLLGGNKMIEALRIRDMKKDRLEVWFRLTLNQQIAVNELYDWLHGIRSVKSVQMAY